MSSLTSKRFIGRPCAKISYMILNPQQVDLLLQKPGLTRTDVLNLVDTVVHIMEINKEQAELLRQALGELSALKERLEFYRMTTIKLV